MKLSNADKENISPSETNFLYGRGKTDRSSDKLRLLRERNKKKSIPKQDPIINDSQNETIKYLENLWNNQKSKLNSSCRESSIPRKTKILDTEFKDHDDSYNCGTNLFAKFKELKSHNDYSFNDDTEFCEISKNCRNDSMNRNTRDDCSKERILTPQIEAENYHTNDPKLKVIKHNLFNLETKLNKSEFQYREKSPERQTNKGQELLEHWDFVSRKYSNTKNETNNSKQHINQTVPNTDNNTQFQSLNPKNVKKDVKTSQRNSSNIDYKEKYYKTKANYSTKNYNTRQNTNILTPKELDKSANCFLGNSQITQKSCTTNCDKKIRRGNSNANKNVLTEKNTLFGNNLNNSSVSQNKPEKKNVNTNLNFKKNPNTIQFGKTITNLKSTKSMPKLFSLKENEPELNVADKNLFKRDMAYNNKGTLDNE